jgi:uncharacterized membrane protein YqaE (UPF0057 family)
MYALAILLPPVAMFLKGRPIQAVVCLLLMLTVLGWPIASIWAIGVVNAANADARNRRLERAVRGG